MNLEKWEGFFEDRDLLKIIYYLAEHFKVLPSDVLNLSVFDFTLNVAIFSAMQYELNRDKNPIPAQTDGLKKFKLKYSKISKEDFEKE